jgi:hypothetical protein
MSVKPLPANKEAGDKTVLQRLVQLCKRRRDVHFEGSDYAPKSILLTTINGILYQGEASLSQGIVATLGRLIQLGQQHRCSAPPTINNPTDPEENLARHWQDDRKHFECFIEYVTEFSRLMERLLAAKSMEEAAHVLEKLFDPKGSRGIVAKAMERYGQRLQATREAGKIRMQSTGPILTTAVTPQTRGIGRNNFWGVEE